MRDINQNDFCAFGVCTPMNHVALKYATPVATYPGYIGMTIVFHVKFY